MQHAALKMPDFQRQLVIFRTAKIKLPRTSLACHSRGEMQLYLLQEGLVSWVESAGKHGLLPDQNPASAALFIEGVRKVPSTAPHPQHVHVTVFGCPYKLFNIFPRHSARHDVQRYHIGACSSECILSNQMHILAAKQPSDGGTAGRDM